MFAYNQRNTESRDTYMLISLGRYILFQLSVVFDLETHMQQMHLRNLPYD